jgi:23S rRNA pseudouridine1911/1915/1917 synthase
VSELDAVADADADGELDVDVPPLLDAVRVDRALSMLTGCTRTVSAALVGAGEVRLDGVVVTKPSRLLEAGQRLTARFSTEDDTALAPEPDLEVDVVLEDPSFLVVDKPAGLVVHPGAGHRTGTLIAGLLARYPELEDLATLDGAAAHRPGIVQRLDKGTSGVLVVARTPAAYASLTSQLQARSVERGYVGLVEGDVTDDAGVIDAPIGRSQRTPTKMAVRASGRPARTAYEVRAHFAAPSRTLLELHLESGRTHQIRVHLAAIGRPIVNDPRYGQHREPRLEEGRVFLHAGVLGFRHPVSDEPVRVTSPLPADLRALLDQLSD